MNEIIDRGELRNINKPARYVGGEVNQIIKINAKKSIVLCYPNIYEKAMSNYIIKLLYSNLNMIEDIWCKRCFALEYDFEELLRNKNYDIYSLEDKKSIKESDILLFVIDDELDYTNFLNMLNLAGIEFDKSNRKINEPKIFVFASSKLNVKPIENFVDRIFNENDEQQNIKNILAFLQECVKNDKCNKYDIDMGNANFQSIEVKNYASRIIPSIKIENLSIIIDLATVHNIEDTIISVKRSIEEQGILKVSFVNQDKMDINKFCELVYRLKFSIQDIRIIVKKMDFIKFSPDILNIILPCMEKSGINFNISTCSKRLRDTVGIGIEKDKLLENVKCVFKNNWSSIKMTFNIGLPNETYADIDEIFNIAEEIVNVYAQSRAKEKLSLIVNINCYIPNLNEKNKYNVNSINKLETKIRYINEKKYDPVIKINIDTIDTYNTKLLLKNGHNDISDILIDAYNLGARFDGNIRSYNKNAWDRAIYNNPYVADKYI